MNRFVSLAAASIMALALHSAAASAQQVSDSHFDAARVVISESGIARSFDALVPEIKSAMRQQLLTQPALSRDLDEVFEALEPEMELQRRAMVNIAARIMAENLAEEELKAIGEFFTSPVGKRYVETQPVVLDDMMLAMRSWQQDMAEYIQVRVRAEMQQRGHQMN
jgi:hypothetical protein